MKKILIRADGGAGIGMGHIMRMLTLAKQLKKNNEVIFICREGKNGQYDAGIKKIREEGFQSIIIKNNELVNEIKGVQGKLRADMLLTDSYDVTEEYFDELSRVFSKTAYMDDVNCMRINVDLIINQNMGAEHIIYNSFPNENTKLLLGCKYVLLRDEFKKAESEKIENKEDSLMITVGGSDNDFLTVKIITLLEQLDCRINVVIGNAFSEGLVSELEKIAADRKNIILYKNCIMSEVMKVSTMAVSACGSTLYELGAMGIPTVGIVVADNQEKVALNMDKEGIIIDTERVIYDNPEEFKIKFFDFYNDFKLRNKMKVNAKKTLSVNGAKVVAEEIINML